MGRLIAIGDIHGCSAALDRLLAEIELTSEDQLVTLGDYVDRGPDSRGVVERLIQLFDSKQLIPLRGNHELMMCRARDSLLEEKYWLQFGGVEALESYGKRGRRAKLDDVPPRHWKFFTSDCRDYHESDDHIFVHAGVEPTWPLDQHIEEWLFWRPVADRGQHLSGKRVICGHSEQRDGTPLNLGHTVCIDTYAYGGCWLTGLDVTTGDYWQATDDGASRRGTLTR